MGLLPDSHPQSALPVRDATFPYTTLPMLEARCEITLKYASIDLKTL